MVIGSRQQLNSILGFVQTFPASKPKMVSVDFWLFSCCGGSLVYCATEMFYLLLSMYT
jgi:hypothetical protein